MADFFISYTSVDRAWAEWVGYVLEEEGFSVIIQAWDFRPGSNFLLEIHRATTAADRTIMVLSPDYIKSRFTAPEWAAALAQDPQGLKRKLVPIMVRQCEMTGLMQPVVHISLVGECEASARAKLLGGANERRAKPANRPSFPGSTMATAPKYPGLQPNLLGAPISSSTYIPNLKRAPSDVEKRRFMRQAFEVISTHFQAALEELARHGDSIECDYVPNTATEFAVEIFINGKSACRCRIWQGGMLSSDAISYAEGHGNHTDNSCSEIFSLNDAGGQLYLSSLMGVGFGQSEKLFDKKRMTPSQAADYLWRRFVAPLER